MDSSNTTLNQSWSSETVQYLGTSILSFFALILILAVVLLWRSKATPMDVTKILGILSVIGISSFLLVAGYTSEQLTPVIGLFGAIVGYLLGKDVDKPN